MVAEEAAAMAKSIGFAPVVSELDAIEMDQLAAMQQVIIVVSTYGEGEMPDNAQLFWDALSASTAPRLEGMKYGILALGDTGYDQFCQAGKLIDTRFEQLGAERLAPRVDCDVDFEDMASEWVANTLPLVSDGDLDAAALPTPSKPAAKSGWSRKNPYMATIVDNHCLSGPRSAKEIRHIAFDLGDSGLEYQAGDAMGVMPVNNADLVNLLLKRVNADYDTQIAGQDAPLGHVLTHDLEISTPPKSLINAIADKSGHEELQRILDNGDKEALESFLWGRDTLDLLNLNPDQEIAPEELLGWLKPLQHRAYSISSSPKAHPGEVHLTVAAVRWVFDRRPHMGVCSTFLADQMAEGQAAGIFMTPNKSFRVPEDNDAPVIMVGPGTGIAPFRAFLQERQARGAKGKNWLFFGDQHRESDFIYEDEIGEMSKSGMLNRLDLAFSRDQAEKVYVQDRMRQNGKALFAWLQDGGHFYVCGDALRMARDVDAALLEIVQSEGAMSLEDAEDYMKTLKKEKRYLRDVY
ncbi:MAG: sulfite reductase subunit alpha [Rhodobacterales bacterium]|nr:MAG: sulfite reductase subunit alpha [Rhodobacterales bacterium]